MITERPESAPLHVQMAYLIDVLNRNPVAQAVISAVAALDLPGWYLGSGGVSQTVWNFRHGFDPAAGLKDYDVVYFDPESEPGSESEVERRLRKMLTGLDLVLDVNNEAHVHLWYERRFGRRIEPYTSTEHAIATWPTTASCVGVRTVGADHVICAPYGLSDALGMVARPNKVIVSQEVYEEKTRRWAARWPRLTVLPW